MISNKSNEEELKSIRESLNDIDGRLKKHNQQIAFLWAESLENDYPWIKHEFLSDANYSSQIDNLLDDLATLKIDLEEFKRSTLKGS